MQTDRKILDHPGTQIYESHVKYADGSPHDVIFNKASFTGIVGNIEGLVGVIVDITERKNAEALLKRFNEELEEKVKARTEERIQHWTKKRFSCARSTTG